MALWPILVQYLQVRPAPIAISTRVSSLGRAGVSPAQVSVQLTSLPGEDPTDWPLTLLVDWDFSGTGEANFPASGVQLASQSQGKMLVASNTYTSSGPKTIRIRVTDADGSFAEETLSFMVRVHYILRVTCITTV
jgi:hypothetical protein